VSFPIATAPSQHIGSANLAKGAERLLVLWHLTSLDAPTVAVVWSLTFAWSAGVHLQPWIPVLQALGVWAIYIADRLLDALRSFRHGNVDQLRERHFFHWQHRRMFLPVAIVAACVCALMIFSFMPLAARERNSLLAAAAFLYFARVHTAEPEKKPFLRFASPLFSKEFLVGVLFTTGCALPALAHAAALQKSLWPLLLQVAVFMLLAWLNCHAIDRWESNRSARPSITLFSVACVAACLLAWLIPVSQPRAAALLAAGALSALILALLDRVRNHLAPSTLRAAADLALLTPAVLLLR
jgi:hypothetical protein